MKVLVAYASKYDNTREIAEHIAATIRMGGLELETDVRSVKAPGDLAAYDAFVIGSAVYYGSWMKEATEFVQKNRTVLANRPVWLFSSGPIGADTMDDLGRDMREVAEPKQIAEFRKALKPRDHRVFFGKLDHTKLRFLDRLVASLPAFPGSTGDFRDWPEVESWAEHIVNELTQAPDEQHPQERRTGDDGETAAFNFWRPAA